MGAAESKLSEKVDEKGIKKEIGECPVVIYTKSECGYCKMAKDLLEKERINYREHELGHLQREDPEGYQKRVNGLVYITRHKTMPQVFICESFIGGFTELNKLAQEGKLKEEISRCLD